MDGELAAVASSAATTIVGLMATDAWDQVKEKMAAFWRHFRPEEVPAIEADLDQARVELATADETVALAVLREWESRLLRLLAADPAAADGLSQVVAGLEQRRATRQVAGGVRQRAKASGHSTVIQVGGDGIIGGPRLIVPRSGLAAE
jgi:hypothetical protein